ncbi:hypothetical protein [Actinoallomurus vinaceus]
MELSLDESVSWRALYSLAMRAAVISLMLFSLFILLGVFSLFLGTASGLETLAVLGFFISGCVYWLVLLLSQSGEPIAEWRTLLENNAPAAASSYAAIYGSLARRRIPVHAAAMRIRSDILNPEVVNNRLVIPERYYVAYVSVFPYGTSLYVGWMMWRVRRGYQLIGIFIKDVIGGIFGRSGSVGQMLRTEKVRAMREAVHSAVREGVEVAVQGVEVPIASTFGRDLPIQDMHLTVGQAAPSPVAEGWNPAAGAPSPSPSPILPNDGSVRN